MLNTINTEFKCAACGYIYSAEKKEFIPIYSEHKFRIPSEAKHSAHSIEVELYGCPACGTVLFKHAE